MRHIYIFFQIKSVIVCVFSSFFSFCFVLLCFSVRNKGGRKHLSNFTQKKKSQWKEEEEVGWTGIIVIAFKSIVWYLPGSHCITAIHTVPITRYFCCCCCCCCCYFPCNSLDMFLHPTCYIILVLWFRLNWHLLQINRRTTEGYPVFANYFNDFIAEEKAPEYWYCTVSETNCRIEEKVHDGRQPMKEESGNIISR